jgi:indole-3-glycerol phosphate synthase
MEAPVPPPLVPSREGFDLIAEIKRRAPSAGPLVEGDVAAHARAYAGAGAAAVSVLTEPDEFLGSLEDVRTVARATGLPVLRKDFLVDPVQVYEARIAGASGVLLIARILDDTRLVEMLDAAWDASLFVLLEAFDAADLARATAVVATPRETSRFLLVGLNGRDLDTLGMDTARFERLAPAMPRGVPRVAESGLASASDARDVARLGFDMALVGTSLLRSADPGALVAEMIAAGREERRRCACA